LIKSYTTALPYMRGAASATANRAALVFDARRMGLVWACGSPDGCRTTFDFRMVLRILREYRIPVSKYPKHDFGENDNAKRTRMSMQKTQLQTARRLCGMHTLS
jgi:hypothetical protein